MLIHWPAKDPAEPNIDYDVDWSARLSDGDRVTSSQWAIVGNPSTITIMSQAFDNTTTKVWLGGGTPDATYIFVNVITTDYGEILDARVSLLIKA